MEVRQVEDHYGDTIVRAAEAAATQSGKPNAPSAHATSTWW